MHLCREPHRSHITGSKQPLREWVHEASEGDEQRYRVTTGPGPTLASRASGPGDTWIQCHLAWVDLGAYRTDLVVCPVIPLFPVWSSGGFRAPGGHWCAIVPIYPPRARNPPANPAARETDARIGQIAGLAGSGGSRSSQQAK